MKKLFLIGLLGAIFLAGKANAQLQKGTRHWGATINFNGDNSRYDYAPDADYKNNLLNATPSIQAGWFTKDNKMVGVRLTTSLSWFRGKNVGSGFENKSGTNLMAINLSPFIRHYKSLSPKWAIFLHSAANLAYIRSKSFTGDDEDHDNGYSAGVYINPGISYWITPRFSVESDINVLSLGASYSHYNDTNNITFNTGVTSSISQYFGVRASWYLQSK